MRKKAESDPKKRKGLIIVHCGDGKGKSTAAYGLVLRALGNKMNVFVMQFMKGQWKTGERKFLDQFDNIEIHALGDGFTWDTQNPEQDKRTAQKAWDIALPKLMSGEYHTVFLDELNYILDYGFLDKDTVLEDLRQKPESVHVIITGRNPPQELIDMADLVTEMKCIKHPYKDQKIPAQKGIEF